MARAFLWAVRGDELEALWRLALVTGMRRGELLGLSWDDVDLDGWQIRVRSTRVTVGATTLEGPPKSRAGRRTLHLDWPTIRLLKDLRTQGEPLSGHVFVDANAEPLQPGWVSRRFTQLITDAGLPRIRFHDLRHTSATLGLAAGESLKAVSRRLGHSDIAITANTYAQVPDATAARDARRLAAGLDTSNPSPLQTVQNGRRSPQGLGLATGANHHETDVLRASEDARVADPGSDEDAA
jgi:integrase